MTTVVFQKFVFKNFLAKHRVLRVFLAVKPCKVLQTFKRMLAIVLKFVEPVIGTL